MIDVDVPATAKARGAGGVRLESGGRGAKRARNAWPRVNDSSVKRQKALVRVRENKENHMQKEKICCVSG